MKNEQNIRKKYGRQYYCNNKKKKLKNNFTTQMAKKNDVFLS